MSRPLLSILLLVFCGCTVLKDPGGTSVQEVHNARPQARTKVVEGTLEEIYSRVRVIGNSQGWEVFREFPEQHLTVFHRIPGSVDTTQVGVFCSPAETGVQVEVSSQGVFSRELVARVLFDRL